MIFQDLIDLWNDKERFGNLENPTHTAKNKNRVCGDKVGFDLKITDVIDDCAYNGAGCVLCIGTAAYLATACIGKPVADALNLTMELSDHEVSAGRQKCVDLAVDTFRQAINEKANDTN